ncbi:MAG: glycosyltransferase [Methylorubrum populi]
MKGPLVGEDHRPPRILFVAMQSSPHTARWIEMIADQGWDLHLFPINGVAPCDSLCGVTLHQPQIAAPRPEEQIDLPPPPFARDRSPGLRIRPFPLRLQDIGGIEGLRTGQVSLGPSGRTAPVKQGPAALAAVIAELKPDIIHSLEFQHAGYLVLQARALFGEPFPTWIATNWGSDIFHFGHHAGHKVQIRQMLEQVDFYSCECHRDILLARDFGYRGPVLTVLPNTGGFDLNHLEGLRSGIPASQRRRIMVKGYQHFAGRALTTFDALEGIASALRGYEIVLYSISHEPLQRAQSLIARGILDIRIVGAATHDAMLRYFGSSRLYVGTSISDAISTSVLEAMAMGAFPIQTNTSCCDEWFDDGVGGFITTPNDVALIQRRILTALHDDELVDNAQRINAVTVRERLDRRRLAPRCVGFYEPAIAQSQQAARARPSAALS